MTTIAVVAWPDGLLPSGPAWARIVQTVTDARPDLLITNEMPFGPWLPARPAFDATAALDWVRMHAHGLEALAALRVPAILSSRPILIGNRLVNEAFALTAGALTPLHQKHYFPAEPGWHESAWFHTASPGFALHRVAGLQVGVLLCTELMFNEHARHLGRAGADLIAVPRATGRDAAQWQTAAAMAAFVGGCNVASSNRIGSATSDGPQFGGKAFITSADMRIVAQTNQRKPCATAKIDVALTVAAKQEYPVYVAEMSSSGRA